MIIIGENVVQVIVVLIFIWKHKITNLDFRLFGKDTCMYVYTYINNAYVNNASFNELIISLLIQLPREIIRKEQR